MLVLDGLNTNLDQLEYRTQCVSNKKTLKHYKTVRFSTISKKSDSQSHQKYDFPVFDFDGSIIHFHRNDQFIPMWEMNDTSSSTATNNSRSFYKTQSAPIDPENLVVTAESPIDENTTTNFTSDPLTSKAPVSDTIHDDLLSNLGVNNIQEIKTYLAKPRRYASYSWPSTAVLNDAIFTINDTWVIPSAISTWLEKLRGYYGLKATLCVHIQLNATPYSAGRLRLAYYPNGEDNPRKASIHFTNAIPFSQLPGVDIECNVPASVLKIPYIAPNNFYEMTLNGSSWGRLDMRVVAPYRTGVDNAQSLSAAMWVWLEDVMLIGQTHSGIVTQSARTRKKVPAEAESKPFTSFFSNLSKAAGSLKAVPIIAPYMGALEWASQAASSVASAFGWSKPLLATDATRVGIAYTHDTACSTGVDMSHPLSVLSDAKLAPTNDASLYGEDEMSINFIKSQWSFLKNFTWTTSNVADDRILLQHNVLRSAFQVDVSATEKYLTPIAFLGNAFTMSRGGIQYKIKIAKTNFHRGQLQITYQPGPSVDANLDASTYLYREVINLSDASEILFEVPYLNPVEYLDTTIGFGRIEIRVVVPLQAPETVSSTIDLSLYCRGADNLEFVRPRFPALTPYVTQSARTQSDDYESALQDLQPLDLGTLGNSPTQFFTVNNATRCASEIVLSISSLLRRYSTLNIGVLTAGHNRLNLYPYLLGCRDVGGDFNVSTYHSYLASPYAYFRGGVRILRYENEPNPGATNLDFVYQTAINDSPTTSDVVTSNVAMQLVNVAWTGSHTINGAALVQHPFQAPNRMSFVRFYNSYADDTQFDCPRGILELGVSDVTRFARSFADDFQLCFWTGVPRLADYVP